MFEFVLDGAGVICIMERSRKVVKEVSIGSTAVRWQACMVEDCTALMSSSDYLVSCFFKNVEDGFVWAFVGIYGWNLDSFMRLLLDVIVGLYSWQEVPQFTDFPMLIFDLGLLDLPLPLVGCAFTWSNIGVWSRLNNFLVLPLWDFPKVCQKRLPWICSEQGH